MTDLLSFLHATLDAAQARAEAAGGDEWMPQDHPADTVAIYDSEREPVVYDESLPTPAQIVHIVANSPAAVLRRIVADRKLIAALDALEDNTDITLAIGGGLPTDDIWTALAEGWGWTGETT